MIYPIVKLSIMAILYEAEISACDRKLKLFSKRPIASSDNILSQFSFVSRH
ncbi:hypothetical protein FDUTEX481_04088 [Tolypothrix sp. PCC 7601]|nr:hypothetical protein FDUTEX481_04088 [Tolypothrix sp. PCC 7601]